MRTPDLHPAVARLAEDAELLKQIMTNLDPLYVDLPNPALITLGSASGSGTRSLR
jgi:hypothetical protein